MKLVELDSEYNVIVNPELFLLDCFAKLRDDRKDPGLVLKEIGYIYYFYNMRSEFQMQTNKKERHVDVKRYVNLDVNWEIDDILQECIDAYLYLSQTVAGKLLASAYLTVDKIQDQLTSIDLNERDERGKPIWNLKQMADTSKLIPGIIESIEQSEKAYLKGQQENEKLRGNKLKTIYENGFGKPKAN